MVAFKNVAISAAAAASRGWAVVRPFLCIDLGNFYDIPMLYYLCATPPIPARAHRWAHFTAAFRKWENTYNGKLYVPTLSPVSGNNFFLLYMEEANKPKNGSISGSKAINLQRMHLNTIWLYVCIRIDVYIFIWYSHLSINSKCCVASKVCICMSVSHCNVDVSRSFISLLDATVNVAQVQRKEENFGFPWHTSLHNPNNIQIVTNCNFLQFSNK